MSMNYFNGIMGLYLMGCLTHPDVYAPPKQERKNSGFTKDQIRRIEEIIAQKKRQVKLKKGLKIFNIDNIEVIALNKKNAIRKVNKIKEILKEYA